MAEQQSASVVSLHQAPKKVAKTDAERAKAYRDRKKAKANGEADPTPPLPTIPVPSRGASPQTLHPITLPVTPSRPPVTSWLLAGAALALSGVGIAINGWFARSLGSTEPAGWLFLAIGVAADSAALALPSCAARLWGARQRAAAAAGWGIFGLTLMFAVTAGLGFASQNIADVTLTRASRVTSAVTAAETALADAMVARDRECKGGVGKFCRDREAEVVARRQAVDAAMQQVGAAADPQADAAAHLVAWVSMGTMQPGPKDVAMLRVALLALLPQLGGLLLMISRSRRPGV